MADHEHGPAGGKRRSLAIALGITLTFLVIEVIGGLLTGSLALLADDIRVTMPPAPYLFEGREAVLGLAYRARTTGEWRLVPTRANAQPAAACYLRSPGDDEFRAYKIDVLEPTEHGTIASITTFGVKHFDTFGLPAVLP